MSNVNRSKSVDLKNCLKSLKEAIEIVKNDMSDLDNVGKDDPFAALTSNPLLEKNLSEKDAAELRKLWLLEVPDRNEFMRDINSLKQQLPAVRKIRIFHDISQKIC